ncbi:WD repeat-containing protein 25-like isoform X3 [Zingiber officinale]|uniref:WD repeat-containing protein 25-like isoform X3 n=1 Tax=Zingiber officinale TaxID=94328 RepID=UPI001C4C187F|nr:WD repeat-containing protein 25-like isoform X3 [Zingiber officinale]
MDLLCKAYGDVSDEDGEFENLGEGKYKRQRPIPPPKRPCSEGYAPVQSRSPAVVLPAQPPSRYVSKRDRAILSAEATSTPSAALPLPNPPITNVEPPGHLLASASMDQAVYVWNVWNKNQQKVCALRYHNAAVKDVRWSSDGLSLLSCGYDCSSRLVDIEKGTETQMFKEEQTVEVVRFHPENSSLFLSGGSKGLLRLWDIRVGAVVKEYLKGLGPILDVEFSRDGKTFISSSDTSNSRISENSIILWDVMRQVPLSNQVYAEAYTCTCVRYHPYGSCFIAQSNGNYIAVFSARLPYKLDKYKRYENHGVWGFPVKCNFSMNGQQIASGSSDGCIYLYDYKSSNLLKKIKAFEQPCVDVAFHPTIPDVIASCSWRGEISVFG